MIPPFAFSIVAFKSPEAPPALIGLVLTGAQALAGPRETGGGDLCENRLKIVRDDLEAWILKGGPADQTCNEWTAGRAWEFKSRTMIR